MKLSFLVIFLSIVSSCSKQDTTALTSESQSKQISKVQITSINFTGDELATLATEEVASPSELEELK